MRAPTPTTDQKSAAMKKEIAMDLEWIGEDPKGIIRDTQSNLTQKQIEKLSEYPLNETLSTFLALRILPTKEDFQKLALYHIGKKDLADQLEADQQVFEVNLDTEPEDISNIGPDYAQEKIANEIKDSIPDLSLTKPFVINRIIKYASTQHLEQKKQAALQKKDRERSFLKRMLFDEPDIRPESSGVKNPTIPMATLGTMYAGYAKLFGNTANASHFTQFVQKHPWVAPLIGIGVAAGLTSMQNSILSEVNEVEKTAAKRKIIGPYLGSILVATPLSYYVSAQNELKARRGQRLNNLEETLRKHPLPTAFIGGLAGGKLLKGVGRSVSAAGFTKGAEVGNYLESQNTETINLIYKELTS